jgi:hypothetical protein
MAIVGRPDQPFLRGMVAGGLVGVNSSSCGRVSGAKEIMYANRNSAHPLDFSREFDSLKDSELQLEAFAVVQKCRKFADLGSRLESREHQRHDRRKSCPPD